jgi:hypothetical protein
MESNTTRRASRSSNSYVMAVTCRDKSFRESSTHSNTQRRIRMVISAVKKVSTLRSVLAFGLMFWCAGAGCMMVSYARAAAIDSSEVAGRLDQSMAGSMSMDAHACCKAKRPSAKGHHSRAEAKSLPADFNLLTTPSLPTPTGVMNCCPLTSGSIVVTSRSQSNDHSAVSQQTDSASILFVRTDHSPLAIPLRLPNRAHSYLLDCAFLI